MFWSDLFPVPHWELPVGKEIPVIWTISNQWTGFNGLAGLFRRATMASHAAGKARI